MASKKPAADFNMSDAIRAMLSENPKLTSQDVRNALLEKHPTLKINKNSFSVAFYTVRKKLGLGPVVSRKRKSSKKPKAPAGRHLSLATLQLTADFLSKVGGVSNALAAIKQLESLQLK